MGEAVTLLWSGAVTTLGALCAFFGVADAQLDGPQPITFEGYTRTDLARFFGQMGFTSGAEIGVESGRYAEELTAHAPSLHLYCVDAWLAYDTYRSHVPQERVDGMYARAQARLEGRNVTFIRAFSVEAAKQIENDSLDFVYIDANHAFEYVVADLAAWVPKVKHGGVISGHDYCKLTLSGMPVGVVEAVQGWTSAYRVAPWFVLGHVGIAPGDHRERPRSWFWVKE